MDTADNRHNSLASRLLIWCKFFPFYFFQTIKFELVDISKVLILAAKRDYARNFSIQGCPASVIHLVY